MIAALALPLAAAAAEFSVIVPEKSSVGFAVRQMGVPMDGRFAKFSAKIAFDPAHSAKTAAQIEVELASVDSGNGEADEEAKGRSWFNVKEFPTARFVSGSVRGLGGNRFEALGKMSIKGRTRDIVVPFGYRQEGALAVLEGTIPLQRLQYGLGEGAWADTATVADEVQLRFRFALAASKK